MFLSELLASSRQCHGGSPLSASQRKCILLSEDECHIINNLLTELARAVLGNIGPQSWQYGASAPRSVLRRPRANIPQYGPRTRLESGYYFFKISCVLCLWTFKNILFTFAYILMGLCSSCFPFVALLQRR